MMPAMSDSSTPARPWLARYPQGVPSTIDVLPHASLVELFDDAARRFASRPAYGNFGQLISFAELQDCTQAYAAWLQREAHIAIGDRVALMMPNILSYPVALFGTLRAGATVVNVNPLYTPRELRHQLVDAGARAIVVYEAMLPTLAEVIDDTPIERVIVARIGDLFPLLRRLFFDHAAMRGRKRARLPRAIALREVLARGRRLQHTPPALTQDHLAFLQYTGGTTGVSKGAMLTHRSMLANAAQNNAWLNQRAQQGEEIAITALPLYHVFALSLNCLSALLNGGMNYLITNPRDIDRFVRELARVPFTALAGVNTLFNALLNHPGFRRLDFSSLRITAGGGAAVLGAVAERWHELTGTPIIEGYGLTEAGGVLTANLIDSERFTGSIGLPLPSTECEIRDDNARALPPGLPGELWARGPQIMQGYWNRPADTAATLTPDGWLKTGDIAVMRENGEFEIVDRKKDLIIVSGFNVYPTEVENVLASHPAVVECAVVGVPDARTGEAVKAFVVVTDTSVDEHALIAHCRTQLTAYKVPHSFAFVPQLPKSNIGKILRRELRETR